MLADRAAAATQNANLYKTTGVDPKTTGIHRAPNGFVVQHDVEDDEYDWPPKMEVDYDSDDSNDDDDESYAPPPSRECRHFRGICDDDDDSVDTVIVEDVLDGDEDDEDDADVTPEVGPEQLYRG